MSDFHVVRHEIRRSAQVSGEDYDPALDMLIVVHRNLLDPDDPTEFGHHIRLQGLAHRKEMWGLDEYADVIDLELKDLERYYLRQESVDYGAHPTGEVTGHYFSAPAAHMQSFTPDYVIDRVMQSAMPATAEGVRRMCTDVALSGIDDVKACLRGAKKKAFPCRAMTALSVETVSKRSGAMGRLEEQTQQIALVSSGGLDEVRQLVTDRSSEMEQAREGMVNHALMEASVPEIMRKRVVVSAAKRGLI